MAIACGHCGASHDSVAEVRSCTGTRAPEASLFDEPSYDEASLDEHLDLVLASDSAPRRVESGASSLVEPGAGDLAGLAGPEELGGSLVVGRGLAAPPPWADAPR
ncbi:MAG: hypothetical protein ABW143_11005, partial [Acidimicrobiales bacterium]